MFEPATIRRLLGHFKQLLEGVVANPNLKLWELPLLTDAERKQLLVDWNRTEIEFPVQECVHELINDQARQTPDAVAIVFGSQQLTYRQLDRRTNQLAHHLQRLGVGPKHLVGICMDRSIEMVLGLIGVMKTGAAYVPLDPSYPSERLDFMLGDSGAPVLLTRNADAQRLNNLQIQDVRTVCLDGDWPRIAIESDAKPHVEMTSNDLLYVIYTSGSTGQPKGVQIPHRAVVNLLHAMRQEPGLTREDVLLSVTSISFDIAALEIFLPLIAGARVVLAGSETVFEAARLAALIRDSSTTVMQATPSLWRHLVESGWRGDKRLKILCGGESLSRKLADQLLDRGAEVWNLYGPTETTIWSTACKVEHGAGPVSIGRPIANTQIYVLDQRLKPVPIGIAGELHIAGEGLACGYLNRPELTAEKFVSNSFATDGRSSRLYKTGDVARYRLDGTIEWLGRSDSQVKLRGHRIDLGEIESALRKHSAVREAVVVLREEEPDQRFISAYLTCTADARPEGSDLRRFLSGKLPEVHGAG